MACNQLSLMTKSHRKESATHRVTQDDVQFMLTIKRYAEHGKVVWVRRQFGLEAVKPPTWDGGVREISWPPSFTRMGGVPIRSFQLQILTPQKLSWHLERRWRVEDTKMEPTARVTEPGVRREKDVAWEEAGEKKGRGNAEGGGRKGGDRWDNRRKDEKKGKGGGREERGRQTNLGIV